MLRRPPAALVTCLFCVASFTLACGRSPERRASDLMRRGKEDRSKRDYGHAAINLRSAAKIQPNNPEIRYELGLLYLEVGDANAAMGHFQDALKIKPAYLEPQLKIAQIQSMQQDLEVVKEAERRAKAALAAAQGNADAVATLAMVEMRLNQTQDAEKRLTDVLLKFPKHLNSSLLLANIKIQNKDYAGAEDVIRRAVAKDPASVQAIVALAQICAVGGRLDRAELELAKAIAIDPNNGLVLNDLAQIQIQQGKKSEAEKTYQRLSQSGDKAYASAYGAFLFSQNRRDEGIRELERVQRANPSDRDARTRLVSAYLATKRLPEAERLLTTILADNKKDTDALLQRSQIYLIAGKYGPAENDLNQVVGFRPDWAEAHYVRSRLYQVQGAVHSQRQELSEALRLDPSLVPARVDLARCLVEAQDAKAALDLVDLAPGDQRKLPQLIVQRNWALLALGRTEQLKTGIQQGLEQGKNPDFQIQSALLKLKQKDVAGARSDLKNALAQNPEELRALDLLARSYSAPGPQSHEADAVVKQYAALHPESPMLQQYLGSWLLAAGNRDDARKAYEAAKAGSPTTAAPEFALAELDLLSKNYEGARNRLAAILTGNQSNVDARVLMGMVEESSGRYDKAIDAYRRAVDLEANNLYALNNLAYRLTVAGKNPDEALKFAQRAFEVSPRNPTVEDTLGWAFYTKGVYASALPHLKDAVKAEPTALRLYHLAAAYARTGDIRRARETYAEATRANPSLPESKAVQKLLDSSPKTLPTPK